VAGDTLRVSWSGVVDQQAPVRIDLIDTTPGQTASNRSTLLVADAGSDSAEIRLPLTLRPERAYALEACEVQAATQEGIGCGRAPLPVLPLTASLLFPFGPEITWTYELGSNAATTRIVAVQGDTPDTYSLRRDSGYTEQFRLSESGLYLQSILDPGAPFELRFDPPLHLCGESIRIGDTVRSQGTRYDNNAEADHLVRPYQAEVSVAGTQQITVPAGSFSTFKLQGVILTADASNILFTLWMAPRIGRVQSVAFGTAPLALIAFDSQAPTASSP